MSDNLLREIYGEVYRHFCEVAPWRRDQLPSPDQVTIVWNPRLRQTQGLCYASKKTIEINTIFKDPRLHEELFHLLCHEAAHFLWNGHPPAFKRFLRAAGVREEYLHRCGGGTSAVYNVVKAERYLYRYTYQCPGCKKTVRTHRRFTRSCGTCDSKWNPQFQLVVITMGRRTNE